MGQEGRIDKAFNDWIRHCRQNSFFSAPEHYLDCSEYKRFISFGNQALPFVRKLYQADSLSDIGIACAKGLAHIAVMDIRGDFVIPAEIAGNFKLTREYTKRWLDENIPKYF